MARCAVEESAGDVRAFTAASTLLGVARLDFTGQLVEADLTAVLPA